MFLISSHPKVPDRALGEDARRSRPFLGARHSAAIPRRPLARRQWLRNEREHHTSPPSARPRTSGWKLLNPVGTFLLGLVLLGCGPAPAEAPQAPPATDEKEGKVPEAPEVTLLRLRPGNLAEAFN